MEVKELYKTYPVPCQNKVPTYIFKSDFWDGRKKWSVFGPPPGYGSRFTGSDNFAGYPYLAAINRHSNHRNRASHRKVAAPGTRKSVFIDFRPADSSYAKTDFTIFLSVPERIEWYIACTLRVPGSARDRYAVDCQHAILRRRCQLACHANVETYFYSFG